MSKQELIGHLTDCFNDSDRVLLHTVEESLLVVIDECRSNAPECDDEG